MTDNEVMQILNFLMNDKKFICYLLGFSLGSSLIVHLIEEFSYWIVDFFSDLAERRRKKKKEEDK